MTFRDFGPGELTCNIDDGEFEWQALFKGPLIAYDKRRKKSFVVYVPNDIYKWVFRMVRGKTCLWFEPRSFPPDEPTVFAYNWAERTLRAYPLASGQTDAEDGMPKRRGEMVLWSNGQFQAIGVGHREFEDALTCN